MPTIVELDAEIGFIVRTLAAAVAGRSARGLVGHTSITFPCYAASGACHIALTVEEVVANPGKAEEIIAVKLGILDTVIEEMKGETDE